ncbi:MAG: ABC transporter ATP-binding protein [Gammaproteobacteria bacterium]
MPALLEVKALVKHYRGVRAVDGISFTIEQGRCFGLLGPNGAGKTTTVEMLEGVTAPTGGEILYKNQSLGPRFRHEAGIMFQSTALQDFITVRETLEMFAQFYRDSAPLDAVIAQCSLSEFLDRDTRKLSGGQRQRLLLAIALVNDPEIIFLDEPTTGLDPQARRNFWALVEGVKARGKTVVLTTHYMEEAYVLCDEIAIVDHGRIIAQGSPKQLLAAHFDDVILQLPEQDYLPARDELDVPVVHHRGVVEIATADVNGTVTRLIEHGVPLTHLRIRERTLEDLFLELTGTELRG